MGEEKDPIYLIHTYAATDDKVRKSRESLLWAREGLMISLSDMRHSDNGDYSYWGGRRDELRVWVTRGV